MQRVANLNLFVRQLEKSVVRQEREIEHLPLCIVELGQCGVHLQSPPPASADVT